MNFQRHLRDNSNPLEMPEEKFKSIYRLSKNMVNDLIETLGPHLLDGQRETFIPKPLKVTVRT